MKAPLLKLSLMLLVLSCAGTLVAQRHSSSSIPDGTNIAVRVNENLSSERTQPGATFTGVTEQAVVVNGRTMYPAGTPVTGRVINAKSSGRLSDPGVLELALTSIGSGTQTSSLRTQTFLIKGESHTKSNVVKIGGTTAAGAVIGAIAGGGKGAAIGAGAGAAAGTGVAAATGKKPASVESEAVLMFVTGSSPASNAQYSQAGNYDNRTQAPPPPPPPPPSQGQQIDRDRDRDRDDGDREDDDDRGEHGKHGHSHGNKGGGGAYAFGDTDRQVMRECLSGYQYESLPPGIQKKLARGGSLPPGMEKRIHPLPDSCVARLPKPPEGCERIIYGDRVIMVQAHTKILDILVMGR